MSIISSNSADCFSLIEEELIRRGYYKTHNGRWICHSRGFQNGHLIEKSEKTKYFYAVVELQHLMKCVIVNNIEILDALEKYWVFGDNAPMTPENFKKYWELGQNIIIKTNKFR